MNTLKKIKEFFKNNYCLLFLIILFAAFLSVLMPVDLFFDDHTYKQAAICDWSVFFRFLKWHISAYNGRTLVHFFIMLLLKYDNSLMIWRVICSAFMAALCFISGKVIYGNDKKYNQAVIITGILLMTVHPVIYQRSVYWLSASFNYLLPLVLLVITMYVTMKTGSGKGTVLCAVLALICGSTIEQVGMMTIGVFVLFEIDYLINNKKINIKYLICALCSIAGYIPVLFSGGTKSRMDDRLEATISTSLVESSVKLIKKFWINNGYLILVVFLLAVTIAYWIIKLKDTSRVSKKINVPVGIVLLLFSAANTAFTLYLMVWINNVKEVAFAVANKNIIFILWVIYVALLFISAVYACFLLYKNKGLCTSVLALVLGAGAQIMIIPVQNYLYRLCFVSIGMFVIFIADGAVSFIEDVKTYLVSRKGIDIGKAVCAVLIAMFICACGYQWKFGRNFILHDKQEQIQPMTAEEMDEYCNYLSENLESNLKSSGKKNKYDIKDFTGIYNVYE